jgi:hypothetical protein
MKNEKELVKKVVNEFVGMMIEWSSEDGEFWNDIMVDLRDDGFKLSEEEERELGGLVVKELIEFNNSCCNNS